MRTRKHGANRAARREAGTPPVIIKRRKLARQQSRAARRALVVGVIGVLALVGCEPGNSVQHGGRTIDMQKQLQRIEKQLDRIETQRR